MVKKSIEETYQKLTQREHVLKRPGMYIGEVKKSTEELWTFDTETNKMVKKAVNYSPGFVKIFDEILTNALDHSQRDKSMSVLKVKIQKDTGVISVYNDGKGIPVTIHKEHNIYVPELIFGNLLSGSNYDDNENRTGAGVNGLGSKATNIFSKKFKVETCDGKTKFNQTFEDNMTKKSKPSLSESNSNYTKIVFLPDYPKFSMNGLDDDTLSILFKKVYDCIFILRKGVKVYLNDKLIKGNGIEDYSKLFFSGENKLFVERWNENGLDWEYGILQSEAFDHISFVNGNNTHLGGKHVDYVLSQVTGKLKTLIETKKKITGIKPQYIKDCIFIFLKATVVNPSFDSQAKSKLTTPQKDFGISFNVSDDYIAKLYKTKITEMVTKFHNFKEASSLCKKTDGRKVNKINVPKLEDAVWAGTSKSESCTLILTEGLSAMTFAMWGRSVSGVEKYGIFPLRGKFLSIRDATASQLKNNEELNSIKKILGLKQDEVYTDTKSLRYSKVMLLTDSDVDGSHISGLIMNFFHYFWPSLLHLNFLQTMKTPILKASFGKKLVEFFTEQDYAEWCENTGNSDKWNVKYYKGLGTSTKTDAKEIFSRKEELTVDYYHKSDDCDKSILTAFSKDKASADNRKTWLLGYDKNSYIKREDNKISYADFINKDLIHFSVYDNLRSIPSLMDGFKPSQRKIMYYFLKKNITKSIKVGQVSGYISAETGYHHGEVSLQQTIINLAQDFIGSNNLNLLYPDGNFGSRLNGSGDSASPRYIFTRLMEITSVLFDKKDSGILKHLKDDGEEIEPEYFAPIIPMILVNGASGIGTGYSTSIPQYNPLDIIENIMNLLTDKKLKEIRPWYKNFKGEVKKIDSFSYETLGIVKRKNNTTIQILEIPVGVYLSPYKEFLETLVEKGTIKNVTNLSRDENTDICIEVEYFSKKELDDELSSGKIYKNLKLFKKFSTSNMYLFTPGLKLKKYDTPEEILKDFYTKRLEVYNERKLYMISKLKLELTILENKMRFIKEYITGKLQINNKKTEQINEILARGNYYKVEKSYTYLTSMPMGSVSYEKIETLEKDVNRKKSELEFYIKNGAKDLWKLDLQELKNKI